MKGLSSGRPVVKGNRLVYAVSLALRSSPVTGTTSVLTCREGMVSLGTFISCFRKEGLGGGQSDLPASAIFSDSSGLRPSLGQGAIFGDSLS